MPPTIVNRPAAVSSATSLDRTALPIQYRTSKNADPIIAYLESHLPSEDLAYINSNRMYGEPLSPEGHFRCLATRLYEDPSNEDRRIPRVFYFPKEVKQVEKNSSDAIASFNSLVESPFFSLEEKARILDTVTRMQQTIAALKPTAEVHIKTNDQVVKLLQEAKLVFQHRGIDGEANVVETIAVIDGVLANIGDVGKPGAQTKLDAFADLYSPEVKNKCELAIAEARNALPLFNSFFTPESEKMVSIHERFEHAKEVVRPQARRMAEVLREVLKPFAAPVQEARDNVATGTAGKPAGPFV